MINETIRSSLPWWGVIKQNPSLSWNRFTTLSLLFLCFSCELKAYISFLFLLFSFFWFSNIFRSKKLDMSFVMELYYKCKRFVGNVNFLNPQPYTWQTRTVLLVSLTQQVQVINLLAPTWWIGSIFHSNPPRFTPNIKSPFSTKHQNPICHNNLRLTKAFTDAWKTKGLSM